MAYACSKPEKLFSYISCVNHEPKLVIKKNIVEAANPLTKISLNLKYLIKKPISTAKAKEV